MAQLLTQQSRQVERLIGRLATFSSGEGIEQSLHERPWCVDDSVIRKLKDEVSHLVSVDIPRAVKLAEATREAAALSDNPICKALADHAYALSMLYSGRHIEALEAYERAETTYSSLREEVEGARIARAKVGVLMYIGRYEEALEVAAKARRILQKHQQTTLLAQLETNVGNIYHRLDQYQEALNFYERARDLFAAQQDEYGLAHVSLNCANQYTALNQFEHALTLYLEAQHIYEKLEMPLLVNQTEYCIAWLYFQRGKFQESLELFAKVARHSQELGDTIQDALCDLDLAEVYLQLNAYDDAVESAKSAVTKFEALEMGYEHVKARMYLGIAEIHLGDFEAAERELQAARHGFLSEHNEVFAALTNIYLSDVLLHRGDSHTALHLCTEAREIFNRQGLSAKAAYAELELAKLKLSLGEVDEAQEHCQSALSALGEVEAPWLKYQCFHLLGNLVEKSGSRAEAYEVYRQALDHLEGLRSSIRVDEFKCTFVKDKLRVYEDLVELCLQAGTEEKIEEALSFVEAAKSRALVDLLGTSQQIAGKAAGASASAIHQQWRELREQLDWYYNRINYYELHAQQCPAWLRTQLRDEVHQRERQLAKLVRRMRIEDAEYTSLQTASRPDVIELRQSLKNDELLVEYYIVNGRVKVFVLGPDEVQFFNDITTVGAMMSLLRRLRFYFEKFTLSGGYLSTHRGNVQTLTDRCLKQLYDGLVAPIAPLLDGKKLIFVPHDVLHYVPFHALFDGEQYLMDRHEISYCPSANVYKLCSDKAHKFRPEGKGLIMGIPDESMPFIRDEVAAVASLWPASQVLLGKEATLEALKKFAPKSRFLHLASHGVFRRDNPMFSALKLGDSWLNFYDIFNLDLNAELVTLSACETGMNEVFPGDELFGLMRGFLYAGAPSLIVSLWVVNDRSTEEFMKRLYSGLSDGLSKRAAIRQAQQHVRQTYPHPYYWAPFILMGAPE